MNLTPMNKAQGCLLFALLAVSLLLSPATNAMSLQGKLTPTPTTEVVPATKTEPLKLSKNPVVARNTTGNTSSEKPAVAVKEQKKHDKSTISRCWSRLMNMAREANLAHRKKKD